MAEAVGVFPTALLILLIATHFVLRLLGRNGFAYCRVNGDELEAGVNIGPEAFKRRDEHKPEVRAKP